ncbi:MAG: VWA domain-containing protein [Actinomycetota bacterium]
MSEELLDRLLGFGGELRHEGLPVGTGQIQEFARAASHVGPGDYYWVGRATLVTRQPDIKTYDLTFDRYWRGSFGQPTTITEVLERVKGIADDGSLEGGESGRETQPDANRASRLELLREKSFAKMTSDELAELALLMSRLRLMVPERRTRRREVARRGKPDLRRTLRRSFRTGGEPVERIWRGRQQRRRRVIFILDVSSSMSAYSRGLLLFAHAATRADQRWEAFCFSTRLTRITRALARTDPDLALDRAATEVHDWDGGTRIGDSLRQFLDQYGHGGLARGAIIVICSDGLDVGDPEVLEEQMQRLGRLAHRVIWLNPLQEQDGYQPLARGMSAALPHVDTFASGHNLATLEALARELGS